MEDETLASQQTCDDILGRANGSKVKGRREKVRGRREKVRGRGLMFECLNVRMGV